MKIPGGWSQTPNEIIAAMPVMSGSEFKCTMVLIRATYGYHRRQVMLTYEDFSCQTGIKSRETLAAALKAVNSRGFFLRSTGPSKWMIGDGPVNEEEADSLMDKPGMAANSSIIGQKELTNSSITEQKELANSSIIEPLPFYKERSPTGKEREGERKGKPPPHPKVPNARSGEEKELAAHPATGRWLEAGLAWPGWQRMAIITQRLGESPQVEALKKARELWLLAGYRQSNIGGILDWYEALCRDEAWRPFGGRTGKSARAPAGGEGRMNPTMEMLLRVKEERMNGG